MKKNYHLITNDEFKRAALQLRKEKPRTGQNAIDIARDHLVIGLEIPEIAKKYECTLQHVRLRIRNIWIKYLEEKEIPMGWIKVETYAPPEMAQVFLEQVETQRESEYILQEFENDDGDF